MSKIKVFCFPYAGGAASIYSKWKTSLHHADIEWVPVELAGRGKRIREPLYTGLPEAVEDLYEIISHQLNDQPYALFGHSLGGLLIYELAREIDKRDGRRPLHLFFSGRGAPSVSREKINYHLMGEDEFRKEVLDLGGTPREIFDHPELIELFLPLLRNDFKLAETDLTGQEATSFDCDITVFLGKEDAEITPEQAEGWKRHTKGVCTFHYFNGGHFFIHGETFRITRMISNTLGKTASKNLFQLNDNLL